MQSLRQLVCETRALPPKLHASPLAQNTKCNDGNNPDKNRKIFSVLITASLSAPM